MMLVNVTFKVAVVKCNHSDFNKQQSRQNENISISYNVMKEMFLNTICVVSSFMKANDD